MQLMRQIVIMRTTVSISDELLAAAERLARERGATLGEVVEAALRREVARGGIVRNPVTRRA